jgi:hypothetical protein
VKRDSFTHKNLASLIFSGAELNDQLENWLNKAELSYGPARAIVAVVSVLISIAQY